MNGSKLTLPRRSFGQTMRPDVWWTQPLLVFLGLSTFIVYSTWAAFQGTHYYFGNYISPFYSPEIFGDSPHSWFGPKPSWWPSWLFFSPALLILWAPGGFRLTCYYYRGAYYKAFWADPPACTVGEPRKTYLGRAFVPAHHAKRAPLLSLSRARFHSDPDLSMFGKRCGLSIQPAAKLFRYRRRHARSRDQCCFARRLHLWLPFAAPFDRRISRSTLKIAILLSLLTPA